MTPGLTSDLTSDPQLSPTTDLVRDLGLDSLDLVELSVELEDEFAIEVKDSAVDGLSSVSSVVDYVVAELSSVADDNRRPSIAFKEGMRAPDMS